MDGILPNGCCGLPGLVLFESMMGGGGERRWSYHSHRRFGQRSNSVFVGFVVLLKGYVFTIFQPILSIFLIGGKDKE